jgi:type I restriction enzyme S subunit
MIKKTIGDLCRILNGYAFKSSHYVENGVRIIRIANVQKGYIDFSDKAFYPSDLSFIKNYMLKEGDILMSLTGNVGRVALLTTDLLPAALNQRVACLRLKDESIYKKFLFHYLNSSSFENRCIRESKGVAQKNMSTEWLKKQKIPYFEMVKQKEISKVLDNITNIINKKQQQISKYDELIKSRFFEMFGDPITNSKNWITNKLEKVCLINSYKGNVEEENGQVWLLNLDMIEPDTGRVINYFYQNKSKITSSTIKFDSNCVLYSKLRPYLNKVVIPNRSGYATSEIISMQTDEIDKVFLTNLLRTKSFINFANGTAYGAKMPRASVDMIKNFDLIVPPKDIQNEFSFFVKKVEELKLIIQHSINESQQLFDSLMQEYFG